MKVEAHGARCRHVTGEHGIVRLRDERVPDPSRKAVFGDHVEALVEQGPAVMILEDMDLPGSGVDARDEAVFARPLTSAANRLEKRAGGIKGRDLGLLEVRDEDPAAGIHRDAGLVGDHMEPSHTFANSRVRRWRDARRVRCVLPSLSLRCSVRLP